MIRSYHTLLTTAVASALGAAALHAGSTLEEYAFNTDGLVSNITLGDPLPGGVSTGSFDDSTGLGSVSYSITGPGLHYFAMFVDHEIDELINTFFNENGLVHGTAPTGLSYEIDEPGFLSGDIYTNFTGSALDNSNASVLPDDVSMALGWDFLLSAGETATITMQLGATPPAGGFYLEHTDGDSDTSVFFSSSLAIRGSGQVPDGGSTLLLFLGAAGGLLALSRRSVNGA